MKPSRKARQFEYDVCLSFAGQDRVYVRRVAAALRDRGVRVFFDEYAETELWGKDLYAHLDQVYRDAARYCVVFISKHYARRVWTNHERESAQARALRAHREYILPARFDGTKIPGLRDTVGFINLSNRKPEQFSDLVYKKLGPRQRSDYLPPHPDRLFKELGARRKKNREIVLEHAQNFMNVLRRMSEQERDLVFALFREACPAELPKNVHVNIDLLRRCTGVAPARIKRMLGGLFSLGFTSSLREDDENKESLGRHEMLVVTWTNLSADIEEEFPNTSTAVAAAMVGLVRSSYCRTCGPPVLRNLDFAQLATVTFEDDLHHATVET